MAYSEGKINLTNAVSMGREDVETFDKIREIGVNVEVRKVPSDKRENFDNMMKKAKNELKMS